METLMCALGAFFIIHGQHRSVMWSEHPLNCTMGSAGGHSLLPSQLQYRYQSTEPCICVSIMTMTDLYPLEGNNWMTARQIDTKCILENCVTFHYMTNKLYLLNLDYPFNNFPSLTTPVCETDLWPSCVAVNLFGQDCALRTALYKYSSLIFTLPSTFISSKYLYLFLPWIIYTFTANTLRHAYFMCKKGSPLSKWKKKLTPMQNVRVGVPVRWMLQEQLCCRRFDSL